MTIKLFFIFLNPVIMNNFVYYLFLSATSLLKQKKDERDVEKVAGKNRGESKRETHMGKAERKLKGKGMSEGKLKRGMRKNKRCLFDRFRRTVPKIYLYN